MENLGAWELIKNGQLIEACTAADLEYARTGNIAPLRNKVYALLQLEKYGEVIGLTENLIKIRNGETDSDFIYLGIAHWLLNRKPEAISIWQQCQDCLYTDMAGGVVPQVILYFAAISLRDYSLKEGVIRRLRKILKSKDEINWPAPLGNYIMGSITENELSANIESVPILKERQLCQTHFSKAIKKLEEDNLDEYKNELQRCISFGPSSYLEELYYLAKGELKIHT